MALAARLDAGSARDEYSRSGKNEHFLTAAAAEASSKHSRGRRSHGYFPEQAGARTDRAGGKAGLQISRSDANGVKRRVQSAATDETAATIRGTAQRSFRGQRPQARDGPSSISAHQLRYGSGLRRSQ